MDFNDRCRELGVERIAMMHKCIAERTWNTDWKAPENEFAIKWGECWKATIELTVSDFTADLGFFVDVLGFVENSLEEDYAMLMSPDQAYTFTLLAAGDDRPAVDPRSVRVEFMAHEIHELEKILSSRGIVFQINGGQDPANKDSLPTLEFASPSGLRVKVWGMP